MDTLLDTIRTYPNIFLVIIGVLIGALAPSILKLIFKFARILFYHILKEISSNLDVTNYRRQYFNYIKYTCDTFQIQGVPTRAPFSIPLRNMYVPLKLSSTVISTDVVDVDKLLNQPNNKIFIIGDAGSGKTTLLKFISLSSISFGNENQITKNDIFPVFIPLRKLIFENDFSLIESIENFLISETTIKPPKNFINKIVTKGNCALLLDGLDEIQSSLRQKLFEDINKWCFIYPQIRIIITSRPISELNIIIPEKFSIYSIKQLEFSTITKFIHNWTKAYFSDSFNDLPATSSRIENEANLLVNAIQNSQSIRSLSSNPLFLSIICLIHFFRAKIPEHRVLLYEECLAVMLEYRDASKGLDYKFSLREISYLLETIAFHFHSNRLREIDRGELKNLLKNLIETLPIVVSEQEIIDLFINRSGILCETSPNIISFSHLTFQEFLSARYILNRGKGLSFFQKNIDAPWWHEVVILYSGLLNDSSPLLRFIIDNRDLDNAKKFILAGNCVIESQVLDNQIRIFIFKHLTKLIFDNKISNIEKDAIILIAKQFPQTDIQSVITEKINDSVPLERYEALQILRILNFRSPSIRSLLITLQQDKSDIKIDNSIINIGQLASELIFEMYDCKAESGRGLL
ncbi:MAG: NACHT domain-containing protein [Candidatus Hodarchaeota archaeon]